MNPLLMIKAVTALTTAAAQGAKAFKNPELAAKLGQISAISGMAGTVAGAYGDIANAFKNPNSSLKIADSQGTPKDDMMPGDRYRVEGPEEPGIYEWDTDQDPDADPTFKPDTTDTTNTTLRIDQTPLQELQRLQQGGFEGMGQHKNIGDTLKAESGLKVFMNDNWGR